VNDLNWIFGSGFLGMRFYDMPNFLICFIFVIWAGNVYKVPPVHQFILILHCLLPFFLNGVLFSYDYMPDALKYWRAFNDIRFGGLSYYDAWTGGNVKQAAVFFTLMPLPVAVSPISLGFFNNFLYVALFFWLYRKKVFTPVSIWFYLLYPSLALYTGMGLRDTFIFIFMIVAVQWAREGKWWFSILALSLLYAIKFQNFFILALLLLMYFLFNVRRIGISKRNAVFVLVASILALVILSPIAIPEINKFRGAMYVEDGGNIEDVEFISGPIEFLQSGLVSGLYFLAKPFPWEVSNILQFIQSIENLVVLLVLFLITRMAWRTNPKKLLFWVLFMALSLTVYGLVVFNYGTAARYRYPFIVIYVLFVCAECQVRKIFPFRFLSRRR
jgi:hypothetical protein